MGLASALSTALTGLTASETTIDVVGNNLANSGTVGFKASAAVFSTQFLQTQSLGSAPTGGSGGTNPRQVGLGTQVAEITPDFTQGTVQISANPSDLAIQGDGFFIVQSSTGENLYTRNGIFKTNSENQLVTVNGSRLLGYGVDSNFALQTTQLKPLNIPLGAAAVAQATQNAVFEGTLTPTGDIADTAGIIQSSILGDGQYTSPVVAASDNAALPPTLVGTAGAASGVGPLGPGTYSYKIAFVDAAGKESPAATVSVTLGAGPSGVDLTNLPVDASGKYVGRRIYRSQELGSLPVGTDPSYFLDKDLSADNTSTSLSASAAGIDNTSDATLLTKTPLNTTNLTGNYTYYATWVKADGTESRPSPAIGPRNVTDGRIQLSNFPPPTGQFASGTIRIYRNLATDSASFYRLAEVSPGQTFDDNIPDATIKNPAGAGFKTLDFDGPKIDVNTLLINVLHRDGSNYEHEFEVGTLSFVGRKGDRSLSTQTLDITSTTTVQTLVEFMNQSLGIQPSSNDSIKPIPGDKSGASAGGSVTGNGQIRFVSNNGVDNSVSVSLSAFSLKPASGETKTPNLFFGSTQQAKGQSAVSDFVAYDSLGIPVNVRVTVDMESRDSNSTTYRWFADSSDNQPATGSEIAVGTGLVTFDGQGNVISVDNDTVSIDRRKVSAISPMQFKLDFTHLSGLAADKATLSVSRQDGSGAGTLSSYIIGEDGLVRGVFSNGISRTLGQIQLARFSNPSGLEQRGNNLFSSGVNSGLPVQGNPGQQGIGGIIAGATELSNTDIGKNLIDLILASTQYRGNTRVVTTAQQLFDELLALHR